MKQVIQERKYQQITVVNFLKWVDSNENLATILLPTGCGKTVTAALCLKEFKNKKILWVAHREELIDQAYNTIKNIVTWTDKIDQEIGKLKANKNSDIVVGSVQTLYRERKHLKGFIPDIIVIDEYHHRSEKNKTYQGLIDRFKKAKILGLTATPWRFDGDPLPLGEILYNMDIGTAIRLKYLVPIVPQILKSNTSLANVKTSMGDFATGELSKAVNNDNRNSLIANKVIELVKSGRKGILFGVDVKHSHDMFLILKDKIKVEEIYADTLKDIRRDIIKRLRNNEIDCLVNNLLCTEGFDSPNLSFAVIARPTRSLSLYCQMVGRPLRLYEGKSDAIIVDVFDKIKVKQSRVTFHDMAYHGDLVGERKRANEILNAELSLWDPKGLTIKKSGNEAIAKELNNFPVFMIKSESDRWTVDDDFLPITSWNISDYQKLITWTEKRYAEKVQTENDWKELKYKPTNSLIQQATINVKHKEYGNGVIVEAGYGMEVKVEFNEGWGPVSKYVKISDLLVCNKTTDYSSEGQEMKVDKVFYICYPTDCTEGRLIEFTKNKKSLIINKDSRMNLSQIKEYITDCAKKAGVFHLVKSNAKWKSTYASSNQMYLISNYISTGKIKFDLDTDRLTKGEASAIIEQMKWQNIINNKFGAASAELLLGNK